MCLTWSSRGVLEKLTVHQLLISNYINTFINSMKFNFYMLLIKNKMLVRNPEAKRPIVKWRHRWNIKIYRQKGYGGVDCIDLVPDRMCVCVCARARACVRMHACMWMYVHMYECMYICMHACRYLGMYVCIHICMYVSGLVLPHCGKTSFQF
jgi:hypothetical protein